MQHRDDNDDDHDDSWVKSNSLLPVSSSSSGAGEQGLRTQGRGGGCCRFNVVGPSVEPVLSQNATATTAHHYRASSSVRRAVLAALVCLSRRQGLLLLLTLVCVCVCVRLARAAEISISPSIERRRAVCGSLRTPVRRRPTDRCAGSGLWVSASARAVRARPHLQTISR